MIKVGTKVRRRRFYGQDPDGQVGTVREVNHKWGTLLIYWPDKDRAFWHSRDDVEQASES